jgi:hypothetical protein
MSANWQIEEGILTCRNDGGGEQRETEPVAAEADWLTTACAEPSKTRRPLNVAYILIVY